MYPPYMMNLLFTTVLRAEGTQTVVARRDGPRTTVYQKLGLGTSPCRCMHNRSPCSSHLMVSTYVMYSQKYVAANVTKHGNPCPCSSSSRNQCRSTSTTKTRVVEPMQTRRTGFLAAMSNEFRRTQTRANRADVVHTSTTKAPTTVADKPRMTH